jgi:glycosyltransferase involved in cell wall biosynthesis
MPLACEILLSSFLSRRYFGIPESDYVFLFFFDARSYPTRKNPQGVINAFRHLLSLRPYAKTRLILKVNGSELDPQSMEQLRNDLSDMISHVTLLHRVLSDNEVKNLVRCCDCFISLHRSEGYGRGIAEAMYLGKPVIATAYSGNMDFMTSDTSLEVGYQLVPVGSGEYPHWQDQVWANPDVDQATKYMVTLIDNPSFGWEIGRRASVHIRKNFGYRTTGLRYRQRLEHIARGQVV